MSLGLCVVAALFWSDSSVPPDAVAPTSTERVDATSEVGVLPPPLSIPAPPTELPDDSAIVLPPTSTPLPSRIVDPNPGDGPDWPIPDFLIPGVDPDGRDRSVPIAIGTALTDLYGPLPARPSASRILDELPTPNWAELDPDRTTPLCELLPLELVDDLIDARTEVYVDLERGQVNCHVEDLYRQQRVVATVTFVGPDAVVPIPYDGSVWERYDIAGQVVYTYTRDQQILVQAVADGWMLDLFVHDPWERLSNRGGVATAIAAAIVIGWNTDSFR
jgi:hypothetical protein